MSSQPCLDTECDLAATGCGPFNLGLAALASRLPELRTQVFEARAELRWHPGLMFDDAQLQLSFLADLVSLVDPTHPLSFLAYLRDVDRMYPFFIREQLHPTRREYEHYLRWAAARLPAVRFGHAVERVSWDAARERFVLGIARSGRQRTEVFAKHLLIGIGTEPFVPGALRDVPSERLLHSSEYLHRSRDVASAQHVTVVGSGQSAAEVVLDLLRRNLAGGPGFSWITRAGSFAPLDCSKLVLEMTTPAYVRYFHALAPDVRDALNAVHWQFYRGISGETLERIHALLYQRELEPGLAQVELRCGVDVERAAVSGTQTVLHCSHRDTGARFEHRTSLIVAATGYRERRPSFLAPIEALIARDAQGRYRVGLDYAIELDPSVRGRIFVANAELHTHGAATPDLGMSAYRNASILNAIIGREVFPLPKRTAFTSFDVPASARRS